MGKTLHRTMASLFVALFSSAMASAQVAVPYSSEFDGSQDGWTTVDNSPAPGKTWTQGSKSVSGVWKDCVSMDEDSSTPDDYYVSPAINVEEGKSYTVKLHGVQAYPNFHSNLTAEVGTDKNDLSTFEVIGTHISCTDKDQEFTDEYTFTAKSSGECYIAFHATQCEGMENYVYFRFFGASIEEASSDPGENPGGEVATESLPFYQNFTFEDVDKKWNIVDKSENEGYTFTHLYMYDSQVGQNWGYGIKDDNSGSNDYLISPAFKLEAGKTYVVDFTHQSYSYGGNLQLELGTSRDDVSTFSPIYTAIHQDDATHNGDKSEEQPEFTVESDGVYYLAFHAVAPEGNDYYYTYVNVNDFMLKEKESAPKPGEPDVPVDLPYSYEFNGTAEGWNMLDASQKSGSTWYANEYGYQEYDEEWNPVGDSHPCVSITTDWDSDVNDYLVSPAFNMKEGKTYVVKVHTAKTNANTGDLSLELTTDRTKTDSFIWISSLTVPATYDDAEKDKTYEFEINKDGVYYVALHARTWEKESTTNLNVFSFSVEEKADVEDEAVALPYTADFTKAADTESGEWDTWTALDRSERASDTWRWNDGAYITFDESYVDTPTSLGAFNIACESSNYNDYLVSPAFNLETGKTYVVTVQAITRDYSEAKNLSIELGTEKKIASSYNKIDEFTMPQATLETEYQAVKDQVEEKEVTVDESGKYYFAIHGSAEGEGKSVYAYVLKFDVREKEETGINNAGAANASAAQTEVYTIDGRRVSSTANLGKGAYILKTKDATGKVRSVKVVK